MPFRIWFLNNSTVKNDIQEIELTFEFELLRNYY